VLQVKGNSMIEDHIMDGICGVRADPGGEPGTLWFTVAGDEATLKRFYREVPARCGCSREFHMAPIMVAQAT